VNPAQPDSFDHQEHKEHQELRGAAALVIFVRFVVKFFPRRLKNLDPRFRGEERILE
jgi:hypothetical protein